ncbi:MAG: 1-deoxy-D-xylulose-5-phosphate synthase, partial [Candidatus Sumerlaeia bacterium]|nr:1-deoxy-D-xylulose-5-phosphate synthase [Candidatus Sumerlaeia bacterium]
MQQLKNIKSPADIKRLSIKELEELATEIRTTIINVVSQNGGHLASSLGAVELIIALHYVFNTPTDRIFWDVSHQAYAHKLLTGRADRFHTLRQLNGISGFCNPQESPYDAFIAGHASTSISAALGAAIARDQLGETYKIIAVIGDGAMTGGLAYEALNNLGHQGRDLIIILN